MESAAGAIEEKRRSQKLTPQCQSSGLADEPTLFSPTVRNVPGTQGAAVEVAFGVKEIR